ncbi:AI-2E family transporter [Halorubrum sp. AD140]|uniref:AI-2E family transporter n=1 Tax=Halorubrum sp. AD140 TaxID=3050073 RepID=UPI002ACCEF75|nr:AI-2E family transporter [Halorubrum sp. AD140]MDZ5810909.1 AI-2E family transporter [Halorubrum sp. AD140]
MGGLFLLGLATTLAYFLLANDSDISETLIELIGGRDSTAYTYGVAVDADLESVFFGNLLFVAAMSVIATVTYAATNLVAPPGLQVPMVLVAGFLTGLASLLPVVVGKIVYVPMVASLGFQAITSDQGQGSLAFVGAVLVAYVVLLDILPQSFLQPYLSGRRIDPILLLFAYLIGPILFGWYGFFLMPILFILVLEAIRIVLPELLSGEPIRPEATVAEEVGTDPEEVGTTLSPNTTPSPNPTRIRTSVEDTGRELAGSRATPRTGVRQNRPALAGRTLLRTLAVRSLHVLPRRPAPVRGRSRDPRPPVREDAPAGHRRR